MLKLIGKHVAIYGSGDLAFRLLGFAVFPIYAHVFTVEQFGIYALVSTVASIAAMICNLGLFNAVQRFYWDAGVAIEKRPALISSGLYALVAWSCVIVLALIVALGQMSELIASRYGISWTLVLFALATVVPEQILQYCADVMRLHFAPWKFALLSFLKNVFGVGVGLVLILWFDGGLEALFAGSFAGAVFGVPIAIGLIRRDLVAAMDAALVRQLVRFGYPFVFAGAAYWLFGSMDRWMLAELSSIEQLGLYAISYKFAAALTFLTGAFGQAWSPIALKLMREESGYRSVYAEVLSMWLFVLTIAAAGIALFGAEALRLLTPPAYWGAAPSLAILVMGIALSGSTQITALGISLEHKTKLFALAAWVVALANAAFNLALVPDWGANGAAAATLLSYGLMTTLYLYWSQRLHPIPLEKGKLLYCTLAMGGILAATLWFNSIEWSYVVLAGKFVIVAMAATGALLLGIIGPGSLRRLSLGRVAN